MIIKPIISSMFILSLLSVFGVNLAGASSTGQYSILPADFTQFINNNCTYFNYGNELWLYNSNHCSFVASIHLPDGVTVTKITMYWADNDEAENIQALIIRSTYLAAAEELTSLNSSLSEGNTSSDVVTSFPIDNAMYEYFIRLYIPTDNHVFLGIRIEYTNHSFLSLINR